MLHGKINNGKLFIILERMIICIYSNNVISKRKQGMKKTLSCVVNKLATTGPFYSTFSSSLFHPRRPFLAQDSVVRPHYPTGRLTLGSHLTVAYLWSNQGETILTRAMLQLNNELVLVVMHSLYISFVSYFSGPVINATTYKYTTLSSSLDREFTHPIIIFSFLQ